MFDHLIFFDSECPLCHRSVKHIIEIDVDKRFIFAPLNGDTAREILSGPFAKYRKVNSLVLVEHYQSTGRKFWIESKAIFKMYWLVGDGWGLLGILSFLPSRVGDFFYRWVAKHRHQFKLRLPDSPGPKERFLP